MAQGMKIAVAGTLRTGSYPNGDGRQVYTTELIVNDQEFAESLSQHAAIFAASTEG